jgi:hypothetical protein
MEKEKVTVTWGLDKLVFEHDPSLYWDNDEQIYMPFIATTPKHWIMLHRYSSDKWFAVYSGWLLELIQSNLYDSAQEAMDNLWDTIVNHKNDLIGVLNYKG